MWNKFVNILKKKLQIQNCITNAPWKNFNRFVYLIINHFFRKNDYFSLDLTLPIRLICYKWLLLTVYWRDKIFSSFYFSEYLNEIMAFEIIPHQDKIKNMFAIPRFFKFTICEIRSVLSKKWIFHNFPFRISVKIKTHTILEFLRCDFILLRKISIFLPYVIL